MKHGFVGNNPINFVDPYGLIKFPGLPGWIRIPAYIRGACMTYCFAKAMNCLRKSDKCNRRRGIGGIGFVSPQFGGNYSYSFQGPGNTGITW